MSTSNEERIKRVQLKSLIGVEYHLNSSDECVEYGIQGKWGKLLGKVPGKNSLFYVMVDDSVYKLSRKSWDLDIMSGLTKYDPLELVKLAPRGITVSHKVLSGKTFNLLNSRAQRTIFDPVSDDSKHNSLVVNFFDDRDQPFSTTPTLIYILSYGSTLQLSNGSIKASASASQTDLSTYFYKESGGTHLWDVIKYSTLFELPICNCGARHQLISEDLTSGHGAIECPLCKSVLFHTRLYPTYSHPSKELHDIIMESQYRISQYLSVRKITKSSRK